MRNIPTKIDGVSVLPSVEVNSIALELMNAVQSAGLELSNTDQTQLAQSLSRTAQQGNFYTDTGTANSCILGNSQTALSAYSEGMVVRFLKSATNSGAVTINVSGLGNKDLKTAGGLTILANQILSGQLIQARYSISSDTFLLDQPLAYGGTGPNITAKSTAYQLTTADMYNIINVTVSASTTITLPALAGVPDGARYTVVRNGSAAFPLILDGSGAELVGSLASQSLWGTNALMEVTKINNLWVITRSTDPIVQLHITGTATQGTGTLNLGRLDTISASVGGLSTSWYDLAGYSIKPQIPGWYSVSAQNVFASNATGLRGTGLLKNAGRVLGIASGISQYAPASSGDVSVQSSSEGLVQVNGSTDILQVRVYQTSGVDLSVITYLKVELVRRTI